MFRLEASGAGSGHRAARSRVVVGAAALGPLEGIFECFGGNPCEAQVLSGLIDDGINRLIAKIDLHILLSSLSKKHQLPNILHFLGGVALKYDILDLILGLGYATGNNKIESLDNIIVPSNTSSANDETFSEISYKGYKIVFAFSIKI